MKTSDRNKSLEEVFEVLGAMKLAHIKHYWSFNIVPLSDCTSIDFRMESIGIPANRHFDDQIRWKTQPNGKLPETFTGNRYRIHQSR